MSMLAMGFADFDHKNCRKRPRKFWNDFWPALVPTTAPVTGKSSLSQSSLSDAAFQDSLQEGCVLCHLLGSSSLFSLGCCLFSKVGMPLPLIRLHHPIFLQKICLLGVTVDHGNNKDDCDHPQLHYSGSCVALNHSQMQGKIGIFIIMQELLLGVMD